MKVYIDLMTSFFARIFSVVIALIQSIILAHYLLPKGRGELASIMYFPTIISSFSHFGVHWAIIYYLRTERQNKDTILKLGFSIFFILTLVSFLFTFFLGLIFYRRIFTSLPKISILISSLFILPLMFENLSKAIFRGTQRIIYTNLFQIVKAFSIFAIIFISILIFKPSVVVITFLMLTIQSLVIFVSIFFSYKGLKPTLIIEKDYYLKMFKYGLKMYAFSMFLSLCYRMDIGIIKYFRSFEEVGYYVTSVSLAEVLWNIPNIVSFVLFPYVVGSSTEDQNIITTKMSRFSAFVVGIGCILLAIFSKFLIVFLYGKEFLNSVLPLIILLPGIFSISIQQILGADISGRGYPGIVAKATFLGFFSNLILNILLIPKFGITAASFSSSISYTLIAIMLIYSFKKISKEKISNLFIL